jgi:hypothetical protein
MIKKTAKKTSKTSKRLPIRQGDVALIPIDGLPVGATLIKHGNGPIVVAFGSATGHAHQIEGKGATLHDVAGQRFVVLPRGCRLVHTATTPVEHNTIKLAAGTWQIRRQFTWADAAASQVED